MDIKTLYIYYVILHVSCTGINCHYHHTTQRPTIIATMKATGKNFRGSGNRSSKQDRQRKWRNQANYLGKLWGDYENG